MKRHIVTTFLILLGFSLNGQDTNQVQKWLKDYEYAKAEEVLEKMVEENPQDGELLNLLLEAQNGKSLLQYVAKPVTVATKTVDRDDFFLYYEHLADRSWREGSYYFENGSFEVFFPKDGDIYVSREKDTLWTAPETLGSEICSEGDETFPLISYDGKRLYFSSDALFGVGGYDIYYSDYDRKRGTWSTPQNLGFPFNSPADDFLYSETADGKYAVFASDRDCEEGKITIYVLKYENWPRVGMTSAQAKETARLKPVGKGEYGFRKMKVGSPVDFPFERIEPETDLLFHIGVEGGFAENNTLPEGLVYQIQLFVSGGKVSESQLKGLSPVYRHKQNSGKTLYAAGVFRKYDDAAAALNQVKKAGFGTAFIIAFNDGRTMNLNKARAAESEVKVVQEEVRVVQ